MHPRSAFRVLAPLGLVLAIAAGPTPTAAVAQDDVLTPLHMAKMRTVTSAVISPEGDTIAYTLSVPRDAVEDEDGRAYSELHLIGVDGTSRPFITGKVGIRSVRFTPDGSSITFLAKREGDEHTSLYRIPVDGGESRKIVEHDTSVSEYWLSPDGKRVAFLAKDEDDEETKKWKDKGFDPLVYEENLHHNRIFIAEIDSEDEPRRLDIEEHASGLSWSPAGDLLAVNLAPTALVDDSYMKERIRLVDVESGKVVRKYQNPGKVGNVRFSPDGKHIAVLSAADPNDPSAGRLFVAPAKGGKLTDVLPSFTERDVIDFAWQSPDTIMFLGAESVYTLFGEVRVDGSERNVILDPGSDPILTSVTLSEAGTAAAFLGQTSAHPSEVYAMTHRDSEPKRLTNSNPWLDDLRLAPQEVVTHEARDGLELQGLLIRPLDERPGKRYPLILTVHGGPESHHYDGWISTYSRLGQMAAANGYAVFYPNYRGSTGRGVAFSKLGQADAAGKEFDDLVDAVDHLIGTGLVDAERVGITGGSYGGYASAWGATYYSDRFAASVMFVGISNNISKTGTTDIPVEMYDVHHRKWLWEDWEYFLERSPIYHIEKANTPILILHGKEDPRVHPSQSMELYRHLKVRDTAPVRLVFYPGEGHGNRRAASRLDYNLRSMRWFDHYLKGDGNRRDKEPPPPELPYSEHLGEEEDEDEEVSN